MMQYCWNDVRNFCILKATKNLDKNYIQPYQSLMVPGKKNILSGGRNFIYLVVAT